MDHDHELPAGRTLGPVLAAVVVLSLVEVAVGALSGSLALMSDAGHLATDGVGIGLTWWALRRTHDPSGPRYTFGRHRSGILVAGLNGIILLAVATVIVVEAVHRLVAPPQVSPVPVLAVAAIALVVNTGLALRLEAAGTELSIRAAFLHVAADALAALSVIVAAGIILTTGWRYADPVASLVIALLIAAGAVRLLREVVRILDEASPRDIDVDLVLGLMRSIDGVEEVHDLHIWSLDRNHRALSAHVTVGDRPLGEVTAMLVEIERRLCSDFAIEHVVLQPECPACLGDAGTYCSIDLRHERIHRVPLAGG